MTRADLFALAERVGWDPAKVEAGLRDYFATAPGVAALAASPGVYDEDSGEFRAMTADRATLDLLGEVAGERRRRGV